MPARTRVGPFARFDRSSPITPNSQAPTNNWQLTTGNSRPAFTLIELLVVISILVLMLALALPAFNYLTGSRSVDAAENTLSAYIGRARAEAIGLQEVRGVWFYIDPTSKRVTAALVHETSAPTGLTSTIAPIRVDSKHDKNGDLSDDFDVYLDLVSDTETVSLPPGITLQIIDTTALLAGVRQDDAYLGFNTSGRQGTGTADSATTPAISSDTPVGGVLLFNGKGAIVSLRYAFRTCQLTSGKFVATSTGNLLFANFSTDPANVPDFLPGYNATTYATFLQSGVGFVLFESQSFGSQGYDDADPQIVSGTYPATEQSEETWIDANATPLLINRYNGTLIRTE